MSQHKQLKNPIVSIIYDDAAAAAVGFIAVSFLFIIYLWDEFLLHRRIDASSKGYIQPFERVTFLYESLFFFVAFPPSRPHRTVTSPGVVICRGLLRSAPLYPLLPLYEEEKRTICAKSSLLLHWPEFRSTFFVQPALFSIEGWSQIGILLLLLLLYEVPLFDTLPGFVCCCLHNNLVRAHPLRVNFV